MLSRSPGLLAVLSSISLLAACSSDSGGEEPVGETANPDPVEQGAQPPAEDDGAPDAAGSPATVLAMSKLLLGDTDFDGTDNPSAWKTFGYNLDGIVSTKNGSNHCKLQPGANALVVKTDGENGVDNAFGASLLGIIKAVDQNASATISEGITNGDFTLMLRMDTLEDAENQRNIPAALLGGGKLVDAAGQPLVPKFDGTDEWPLVHELLNGGDPDDPKVKFPASYVTGGVWVSGSRGNIDLTLAVQGTELTLNIREALITVDVEGTGADATGTHGIIAGVMNTETLIEALRKVAGQFDTSLCEGSAFEGIAAQIRAASDIMSDATNGDPSQTCDGISIGLGFEMHAVIQGEVLAPAAPSPNPCDAAR